VCCRHCPAPPHCSQHQPPHPTAPGPASSLSTRSVRVTSPPPVIAAPPPATSNTPPASALCQPPTSAPLSSTPTPVLGGLGRHLPAHIVISMQPRLGRRRPAFSHVRSCLLHLQSALCSFARLPPFVISARSPPTPECWIFCYVQCGLVQELIWFKVKCGLIHKEIALHVYSGTDF
jgi:hypothetical protein